MEVRATVCEGASACLCMCIRTARRSHEKFLLGAVVCFLSVKSYMGNIQNIFRQTPSWWWWTLEVTQYSGGNNVYHAKDFMLNTLLFIGVCICPLFSFGCFLLFVLIAEAARHKHTLTTLINDKLDPIYVVQATNTRGSAWALSSLLSTVTVLGDLSRHVQHTNWTFGS